MKMGESLVRVGSLRVKAGGPIFARGWRWGWKIPITLSLPEWSDKYRILPRAGASEYGQWRTDRTPPLREIMVVLSEDHPSRRIVFKKGIQVGATEIGINWLGSTIHQAPCPMMVIQPTSSLAKRWSKQRLGPTIDAMPVLRERIKPARSRDSGNTTLLKEFPGGLVVVAGANSAVDLRMMPVKKLHADEVDGYPEDVDGEGSPLVLGERRTATYPNSKIYISSTPTIKHASVIDREYEASDQRQYHVPCPHCKAKQVLRDENLRDDGSYLCESCGVEIEHHHKTWMLEQGEWIAANPESTIPGFHLSALYAPVGLGYSWAEIADERKKSRDNPELMQAYVNTLLGESYEDESGKVEWDELKARAGEWSSRTIPEGCMILTAGIDVQGDRFAVTILGWGRNERCWVIDWFEIPADTTDLDEWNKLDKNVFSQTFKNQWGIDLRIVAGSVDTGGHWTHQAYNYCRIRKARHVIAVKGDRYKHKPIIAARPSKMDVNTRGGVVKGGVNLWFVGTDTAKGIIFARLNADANKTSDDYHINFPKDLPDDFYMQLTAERFDSRNDKWSKITGRRNEGLDCFVYAYAAACHPAVRISSLRDSDWDKLESQAQPPTGDLFSQAPENPIDKSKPAIAMPPQQKRGRRMRSKGIKRDQ